jgi:hypothetical protein
MMKTILKVALLIIIAIFLGLMMVVMGFPP